MQKGPEPGTPQAQAGGFAVLKKYGREHYQEIGRKGGEATKATADYAEIGRAGGESTKRKYGSKFYAEIGRQGGQRRGRRKSTGGN